jgi:probable rRNA maturation factor
MPHASQLLFQHPSRSVKRRELKAFLSDLAERLAEGRPVTCLISTDDELRRLNRSFRKKDYATDVLSFPSPEGLGELAISLDRAAAQAEEMGHSLDQELRILILHGMLHLIGMDHESDHGEMAKTEALWRKRLKLPSGLIERAHA